MKEEVQHENQQGNSEKSGWKNVQATSRWEARPSILALMGLATAPPQPVWKTKSKNLKKTGNRTNTVSQNKSIKSERLHSLFTSSPLHLTLWLPGLLSTLFLFYLTFLWPGVHLRLKISYKIDLAKLAAKAKRYLKQAHHAKMNNKREKQ